MPQPMRMQDSILIQRTPTTASVQRLTDLATRIRRTTISLAEGRGPTHLASALSLIEVLAVLYGQIADISSIRSRAASRDRVILSKAHGAMALYSTFVEVGLLERECLRSYGLDPLPVHPARGKVPGVELTCGSLGNGLGTGVGVALAAYLDARKARTFVVLGDGECQEGSTWEAAALAPRVTTAPLTAIVDCNGLQQNSLTSINSSAEDLTERFKQLGWLSFNVDGHDVGALTLALSATRVGQPTAVIAKTVKGKGVSALEGNPEAHYVTMPLGPREEA